MPSDAIGKRGGELSAGMVGTAGSVVFTVNGTENGTEYTVGAVNNEATYTDSDSGITYTIILSYSKGNWTYVYSETQDYTASGTALSETVTVNTTIADDGTETVNSVTVGSTSCTENDDGTWSYDSFDVSSVSLDDDTITVSGTTTTISVSLSGSAGSYGYTGSSSTSNNDLKITRMSVTSTNSASTDCFIWSYKVAADTAGYTPFLAGEDNIYYINGYSVGDDTTDNLSIKVDSSTGWFASLYAVGASAQSSNGSYDTVITDSGAVSISSSNTPISVWGTSARSGSSYDGNSSGTAAGDYWEGVCLFLANSSTEALAIRMDTGGWDDWYDSSNLTLYDGNCSMDSTDSSILNNCVWCYTITYNSSSETIITFQAYAVETEDSGD